MRLGVETGGTKILARLVGGDGEILADGRWPTTTPEAAAEAIVGFVRETGRAVSAIGMAAFGPLLVDLAEPDHGRMLATAKPGWTGANLRLDLATRLGVPARVDTDVNAAALAERAIAGLPSLAYLTVGTGIGAGLATTAGTLKGALHPEIGHIRVVRREGDAFASACPFHPDCAEGLAAGPALAARLAGASLEDRPEVAAIVADYVAQLAVILVLTWAPHRIVVGGGVGGAPSMLDAIRQAFARALDAYGLSPRVREPDFIAPPTLADAGLEGALLIAKTLETA
jgi:fructokinase